MFMNDYEANMIYKLEYRTWKENKYEGIHENQKRNAIHLGQLLVYMLRG
ncbi:hypothetical protein [Priestia abyssalis]|nr:hypothetical protein [Priestia abyssalis]